MDITKRLIGTSAILSPERRRPIGIDLDGLVRRLILFDTYILKTLRLQEFPFLVASLGFDGTMELLKSPAFEIESECVSMTQVGQLDVLSSRTVKGLLPPLSYCISAIDAADYEKYVHDNLQPLHQLPELKHKQVLKLKRAIVDKIARLPKGFAGTVSAKATSEILSKPHLVKKSVAMAARRIMNVELDSFELTVHAIDAADIRIETDLPQRLKIDLPTAHKVVENGLIGVAGLVYRFSEMEAYSALSGFIDDDLPLVSEPLTFIARSVSPTAAENNFQRVVTIAGLPDFSPEVQKVNMGRLLEIRDSDECREFRGWLPTIAEASDKEIHDHVQSLRAKFGNAAATAEGKAARLLATTGIGFIPVVGTIAGLVAGSIDTFLLEKLLPKSGPVAFLSKLFPSVFENRN